jgi:heme iron utilization protein
MTEADSSLAFSAERLAGAIRHMNDDHADAVLDYARGLAGMAWADSATLTAIDRFGIELVATSGGRAETTRIPFDAPLVDAAQLRPVLVALAQQARLSEKGEFEGATPQESPFHHSS